MFGTVTKIVAGMLAVTGAQATVAAGADAAPAPRQHGGVHVTTKKTLDLPGVGGHGDVVVADRAAHSVYLSQSPDNNVVVLNTRTNRIRAVVAGVSDANGITYSRRYVFVAQASTNQVAVISKATWRVVARVASGGTAPDAVYYDHSDRSVFVGNVTSNNMEEFSAKAPFTVRGTLSLPPAHPTNGEDLGTYVRRTDRIYQSVDNTVVVINARTRTVEKVFTLPVAATESSKDIHYNPRQNLLWVATTASEVMAVRPGSGAVVTIVPTASGIDEVSGDPRTQLLYLGEGDAGVMGIVNMRTKENIRNVPTEPGFHTLAHLPGTNRVYAYLNFANKVRVYDVHRKASAKK